MTSCWNIQRPTFPSLAEALGLMWSSGDFETEPSIAVSDSNTHAHRAYTTLHIKDLPPSSISTTEEESHVAVLHATFAPSVPTASDNNITLHSDI